MRSRAQRSSAKLIRRAISVFDPLQAADVWAYETYKNMVERILPINAGRWDQIKHRREYVLLFKRERSSYSGYWNIENLSEFAEKARAAGAVP